MTRLSIAVPAAIVALSLLAPVVAHAGSAAPARDPFRPFFLSAPVSIAPSPLQRYSLDELHVEGIVNGTTTPRALVSVPDGDTFEVSVGAPIGNHEGKIAQITDDAIVVVERDPKTETAHELILGISTAD